MLTQSPAIMSQNSAAPSDWRRSATGIIALHKHILASGEMSDVRFAVGRQHGKAEVFPAHKFVLSLSSTVFHTMFHGSLPENGQKPIDVPEILPDAFRNMLKYIYTGSLEENGGLKAENIFETIYCADKYDLPMLSELCARFLSTTLDQLNADSCLVYMEKMKRCASLRDRSARILEICLKFVDENSQDVLKSDQFSEISQETLMDILRRDTLSAAEDIVYAAVENWAEKACIRKDLKPSQDNRRAVLGKTLNFVRFPLMTDGELGAGPVKSQLLLDSEIADLYRHKHSSLQPELPFPTKYRTGSLLRISRSDVEFRNGEKVFVDTGDTQWWYPAVVTGTSGPWFVALRKDKEQQTLVECALHQIVRAASLLKFGQEIMALETRRPVIATLRTQLDNIYWVKVKGTLYSRKFDQLRIGRDQMEAWKKANRSSY
ncbi:BTB/POZ domain-containing protein 3-like [Paramacrobiotus metropolitanus]|uniref:BTB/POZ domain-containing protein 3-like n=1 Tax=Paramacrobiotus metropolitanus TaxID=2943436 RepID=UPI0024463817|nr:BTB/POZ domain-containing protein 3-like [Paramacrobiotus metropolitanus]